MFLILFITHLQFKTQNPYYTNLISLLNLHQPRKKKNPLSNQPTLTLAASKEFLVENYRVLVVKRHESVVKHEFLHMRWHLALANLTSDIHT